MDVMLTNAFSERPRIPPKASTQAPIPRPGGNLPRTHATASGHAGKYLARRTGCNELFGMAIRGPQTWVFLALAAPFEIPGWPPHSPRAKHPTANRDDRSGAERRQPARPAGYLFLRRSFRMPSSASITSSRDDAALGEAQFQIERFVGGRYANMKCFGRPAFGLGHSLADLLPRGAALAGNLLDQRGHFLRRILPNHLQ